MIKDIKLEILPSGHIKFKRGDKAHNDKMKEIISFLVEDEAVVKELKEFFDGSEEVEMLVGDTIFCG